MTADPPVEERLLGKVCRPGASPAELEDIFKSSSLKRAALEGGVEWGKVEAGHSAGLVDDIVSAAELFRRLVREMEEARKRLDAADRRPPPGRPRAQRWSTRYGNGIFRASRFARTPPVVVLHGSARSVEHQASELNRVCSQMAPI
jgi:hypothetical protein